MAVYASNILIEQGFDFSSSFALGDSRTNSSLNITGYGVSAQLRKSPSSSTSVSFASTILDSEAGVIELSLSDEQTLSLKPGRYVYDVLVEIGGLGSGGKKYKAFEGMALVRPGVTR
jgi:hypothetical protein